MLVLGAMLTCSSRGQEGQPTEYQIKAAFIFNFARFVEWPANTFTNGLAPMVIGILGDDPFGNDLENTLRNKSVNEHPLQIEKFRSMTEITNCHILFISSSEKQRAPEIVKLLQSASVLTVSETEGFPEAGGMINFVKASNKVRFQINDSAARKAKLKISSKLLSLALPSGH